MEVFSQLPSALRHKILHYFKNPECDHLLNYWRELQKYQRQDLLVSLNRYNYFRFHRKKYWDKFKENGRTIIFEFGNRDDDDTYLSYLNKGWWKPCDERYNGMKLRMALFNTLDDRFWTYHGDCGNPAILADTIFDPNENKRDIENDFNVAIPNDRGHPPEHYDTWRKRGGEGGALLLKHRRKLRVPRTNSGNWHRAKALIKIKTMREKQHKTLMRRTWCRWYSNQDPNHHCAYYEINYSLD